MSAPGVEDAEVSAIEDSNVRTCMLSLAGLMAPGVGDVDVNAIEDPQVRACMLNLASQISAHQKLQNEQFQLLLNGQNSMYQMMEQIAQQSRPPIFPMVVHAATAVSSATKSSSSLKSSSAKSSRKGSSTGSSNGDMLTCPFCGASHDNEKSHWQHVDRLAKRIGKLYFGACVIPENHLSLRHFAGESSAARMLAMLRQYNSFISSSKDNGVDSARAAQLSQWLESIR